jgi:arginine/lysine/ornithine decarboxylase
MEALHLWDDLIDKDHVVSDRHVHRVFTNMLVEMPRNPFYQAHAQNLAPVLIMAIQNWHVANAVERNDKNDIPAEAAFVLRSAYVDMVTMVATICGGYDYGVGVAKRVRALAHREGFQQYLANLEAEKAAREQE